MYTVKILNIGTDRSEQVEQIQIRLLLEVPFDLHLLEAVLIIVTPKCSSLRWPTLISVAQHSGHCRILTL